MAKRAKRNPKIGRGGRIALIAFTALLLALALAVGGGMINANVLHIRRAEVQLQDLPAAFDGVKLLYASDIDLCGLNTAGKSAALFEELQSLKPDILLLGGDYSAPSLLEILNNPRGGGEKQARQLQSRTDFFHYIASFQAPMGKYAIASPEDPDWDGLRQVMEDSGIHPLFNQRVELRSGGESLWLAGVCQEVASLNSAGSTFSKDDCVVVAAYSPTVLPILLTSEAADGGQWTDLALCGLTHGGQVLLLGRTLLNLDSRERQFLSGWRTDSGFPILVTQGVGCEGVNLRLGTVPEVWLITLRRE